MFTSVSLLSTKHCHPGTRHFHHIEFSRFCGFFLIAKLDFTIKGSRFFIRVRKERYRKFYKNRKKIYCWKISPVKSSLTPDWQVKNNKIHDKNNFQWLSNRKTISAITEGSWWQHVGNVLLSKLPHYQQNLKPTEYLQINELPGNNPLPYQWIRAKHNLLSRVESSILLW